ncbi:MAG: PQQ-binding-like beta-propeller repeat protein [Candidatus Cloacimonetes bacterium]|nr:PQQ-binding-like beta-propeller repeat protein [Candidatus Cloacimonadota bacterium]
MKQQITFAFAADPHVGSLHTRDWLIEDLGRIRGAEFIVIGGDLTWSGSLQELNWYKSAIETSSVPVYSVFGGHDGNELLFSGAADSTANYRKVLGNPWYAFDAGHARAMCTIPPLDFNTPGEFDYLKPEQWQKQEKWLAEEIQNLPDDKPLLMFQHMPTTRDWPASLGLNPLAVFMGHWHLLKVWQQNGTLFASVPPISVAGYGGFPRGYFQCSLTGHDLEIRFKALDEKPAPHYFLGHKDDSDKSRVKTSDHTAWVFETGGHHFLSSPVLVDRRVYLAYVHEDIQYSTLICISADSGQCVWKSCIKGAVFSTPVVSFEKVLAMTVDGTLHAFNLEDGMPVWTVAVDSNVNRWAMDGFSVSDELVFLRTTEHVVAIQVKDGVNVWKTAFKHHDWIGSRGKPLASATCVFVPAVLGKGVTCFNRKNGEVLWETDDRDWFERLSGGLALDPSEEKLICVAFNIKGTEAPKTTEEGRSGFSYGGLIAINARTGRIIWRNLISSHNYTHPVIADELILLSDTVTGRLIAVDIHTGEEQWTFRSGPSLQCVSGNRRNMPGIASAPSVYADKVYTGAADGVVYELKLSDGKVIRQFFLGSAVHAKPAVNQHLIIVPTSSGTVVAINRQPSKVIDS